MNRRSKQHVEIYNIIKEEYPTLSIIEEYNIGEKLFLDIYLPDIGIAIEINGKQHYEYSEYMHQGNIGNFYLQQMRDKKKSIRCKHEGIFLFTIKYDDKRDASHIMKDIFKTANERITTDLYPDKNSGLLDTPERVEEYYNAKKEKNKISGSSRWSRRRKS